MRTSKHHRPLILLSVILVSGCGDGAPSVDVRLDAATTVESPSEHARPPSTHRATDADGHGYAIPPARDDDLDAETDQPSPTTSAVEPASDDSTPAAVRSDEPSDDPSPTKPPVEAHRTASLGEVFTLSDGETVLVEDVEVTLLQATGPSDSCDDCPIQADVRVADGSRSQRLSFSFSGNMAPNAEEAARTEEAFGRTFRAERIVQGQMDLTVT